MKKKEDIKSSVKKLITKSAYKVWFFYVAPIISLKI